MDKQQFKDFCKQFFISHGFVKKKNMFYLAGKDLLCGIKLQKSSYGPFYYVNYYYFVGQSFDDKSYPTVYEHDIASRIIVMSKTDTINGKNFLTSMIEYEEYYEEELKSWFDKAFNEDIMPPIRNGKTVILDNLNKPYLLGIHREETMEKLKA